MKVMLKDIRPNPFRYINKGYPIDARKVEMLRTSIKRTGFWDNLVGRQVGDHIEIAYGHHRVEALRAEYKPSYEMDIILKELDDATMLKIMASENETMDIMSPAVINETCRAAMDFLNKEAKDVNSGQSIEKLEKLARSNGISVESMRVALFLNWPPRRVQEAMKALHAIKSGLIDKDDYEAIPFQESAERFRVSATKYPISKSKRLEIVAKLRSGEIGKRGLTGEFIKAKFGITATATKRDVMLEDVVSSITGKLRDCSGLMTENFLANAQYISTESIEELSTASNQLYKKLKTIKGKLSKRGQLLLIDKQPINRADKVTQWLGGPEHDVTENRSMEE